MGVPMSAGSGGRSAARPPGLLVSVAVLLMLGGCHGAPADSSGDSRPACLDGGRACAAAAVPPGQRGVRHGYRIRRFHWREKTNRETGAADVGLQADWEATSEYR